MNYLQKSSNSGTIFPKLRFPHDLRQTEHFASRCKTLMYAFGRRNSVLTVVRLADRKKGLFSIIILGCPETCHWTRDMSDTRDWSGALAGSVTRDGSERESGNALSKKGLWARGFTSGIEESANSSSRPGLMTYRLPTVGCWMSDLHSPSTHSPSETFTQVPCPAFRRGNISRK